MNKEDKNKIFYELDKARKHSYIALNTIEKFLPYTEKYYLIKHIIKEIENTMDEICDIEVDKK